MTGRRDRAGFGTFAAVHELGRIRMAIENPQKKY